MILIFWLFNDVVSTLKHGRRLCRHSGVQEPPKILEISRSPWLGVYRLKIIFIPVIECYLLINTKKLSCVPSYNSCSEVYKSKIKKRYINKQNFIILTI